MSNVLIGIIGVILFIGLALAGALILGDDFRSASAASQAASLMSQLKQAADAADMRKLKLGVAYTPAIETDFLVPRFLKTPAVNNTSRARMAVSTWPAPYWYQPQFNNNLYLDAYREPTLAAKYLVAPIGPSWDERAKAVCQTISETYGVATIISTVGNTDPQPAAATGCILGNSAITTGADTSWYIAYQRIEPVGLSASMPSGYTGG
jgi:hypothetical protein